jgi:hypothetical protein
MNTKDIANMTQEWIEAKGNVTCEFSCSLEDVNAIYPFIVAQNEIVEPKGGFWTIRLCSVCKKYDEEKPFHVELQRDSGFDDGVAFRAGDGT